MPAPVPGKSVPVVATSAVTLPVARLSGDSFMASDGLMGGAGLGMPLIFGGNMMLPGMMVLAMLALPVLVIVGVVWVVVALWRGSGAMPAAHAQTPLDILKARYARGESTKDQYDDLRQHLAL